MTLPTMASRIPVVRARSWAVTRVVAGVLLVLLYVGASSGRWLRRTEAWPSAAAQDEISAYDHRFDGVKSLLPSRGVVGYVSDPLSPEAAAQPGDTTALRHFRRYLLAQYALAPRLLVESTRPEFVIGNFARDIPPSDPGLQVVRDFGNGVVLYRRLQP
jgi:hypothetical protein